MTGFVRNAFAATAGAALITTPLMADQATQARDLVGARASTGQSQLEARGYTYITGSLGDHNTRHSYFWNGSSKHCLHVETYDGRYTSITDASKGDCNQHHSGDTAAAVGAVAAVGLIAALASGHKKHHHEDGRHYDDVNDEAHYDRGYNDAIHSAPYHNWDNSNAYSGGYNAGVQQRMRNTAYHHGSGGYHRKETIADLRYQEAKWARDELSRRGFLKVDELPSRGEDHYSIFWQPTTRQCVQATVVDHRIYDIRDIGRHPNCR